MVQSHWWVDDIQGADLKSGLARIESIHVPLVEGFQFDAETSKSIRILREEGA